MTRAEFDRAFAGRHNGLRCCVPGGVTHGCARCPLCLTARALKGKTTPGCDCVEAFRLWPDAQIRALALDENLTGS